MAVGLSDSLTNTPSYILDTVYIIAQVFLESLLLYQLMHNVQETIEYLAICTQHRSHTHTSVIPTT